MARQPDHLRCQHCNGPTYSLSSHDGDPEDIRNDRHCPKCHIVYGMSKSDMFKLRKYTKSKGK
jgi:Zn finger protein HypA/HybF involved in hydrogenase expression